MLAVALTLLVGLLIAGAIVLYVAFPLRGEPVPVAPVVGQVLERGVRALPVIEDEPVEPALRR